MLPLPLAGSLLGGVQHHRQLPAPRLRCSELTPQALGLSPSTLAGLLSLTEVLSKLGILLSRYVPRFFVLCALALSGSRSS